MLINAFLLSPKRALSLAAIVEQPRIKLVLKSFLIAHILCWVEKPHTVQPAQYHGYNLLKNTKFGQNSRDDSVWLVGGNYWVRSSLIHHVVISSEKPPCELCKLQLVSTVKSLYGRRRRRRKFFRWLFKSYHEEMSSIVWWHCSYFSNEHLSWISMR